MAARRAVIGFAALLGACLLAGCSLLAPGTPESSLPAPFTVVERPPGARSLVPTDPLPQPLSRSRPRAISPAAEFDTDRAMRHLRTLVGVGVRQAGSDAEKRAADYVMSQLRAMGLEPIEQTFQLPDGRQSRNVICLVEGESDTRVILGAHIDSKAPSPGANDNASGAALLLELARVLAARPAHAAVELDFFGAEEVSDSDPNHHHAGSRARAARLSSAEIAQLAGMVSVDMVGYGQSAHVRTMGRGPRTLADALIAYGRRSNLRITYLLDPGETGWSDHEAFELLGIPSAWFEWRRDATTHTAADSYARQQPRVMRSSGRLLEGWVRSLNGTGLDALVR